MDDDPTDVVEKTNSNTAEVCSDRETYRQLGLSQTTVWICMRLASKIHRLQGLKICNNNLRETVALTFLARMGVE